MWMGAKEKGEEIMKNRTNEEVKEDQLGGRGNKS